MQGWRLSQIWLHVAAAVPCPKAGKVSRLSRTPLCRAEYVSEILERR